MKLPDRRPIAVAAALLLGWALTACGSTTDAAGGTATDSGGAASQSEAGDPDATAALHDDADTAFAQGMIVHHEGAVEMAELAVQEATTDDVRALAERIAAAQQPEIELMSGWLEAWGEERAADPDAGHAGHDGMDMAGLDQEEAMSDLRDRSGAEFDRRFLELMTAHHEGAIEMAETELAEGESADALDLARRIVGDQTAEIAEMEQLLDGL